jgi:hypothetical protein
VLCWLSAASNCLCSASWRWATRARNVYRLLLHNQLNTNSASCWPCYTHVLWCAVNKTLSLVINRSIPHLEDIQPPPPDYPTTFAIKETLLINRSHSKSKTTKFYPVFAIKSLSLKNVSFPWNLFAFKKNGILQQRVIWCQLASIKETSVAVLMFLFPQANAATDPQTQPRAVSS